MTADTLADTHDELWDDPRRWRVIRRAHLKRAIGAGLLILATMIFVPAVWIVAMPRDPLLRPDLFRVPAIAALALCPVLIYFGRKIVRRVWVSYGAMLYGCVSQARQAGLKSGITFDIELPQLFPRVLFARRHRIMAIALPYPLLLHIDDIESVNVVGNKLIALSLKDKRRHTVHVVAGDGLTPQPGAETRYVAERLKEFVFMPQNTETEEDVMQRELQRAFREFPSLR